MAKDTYPIFQKGQPLFTFDRLFKLLLILAVIILWYKTCHPAPSPVTKLEPVTSVKDQKDSVRIINQLSDAQRDSINELVGKAEEVAATAIFQRDNAQADNLQIQKEMDALLSEPVPDTCTVVVAKISTLNQKLKESALKQTKDCNAAINAKNGVIKNKDGIIAIDKKQINSLRASLDTAFKQQSTLQANIKKLKPRASIGIGVIGEMGWVQPYKFDAGFQLYYHSKNGTQIGVGVLSSQRAQLTYSKTLFKL